MQIEITLLLLLVLINHATPTYTPTSHTQLMLKIGNDNSNSFWEHHYKSERLPANVEDEIRENFLSAKYVTRSWIPQQCVENKDSLDQLLCENVATDTVLRTIELIALGANVSYRELRSESASFNTTLC